jgi:pyrroloquinoline quinone biosynthesis protein D
MTAIKKSDERISEASVDDEVVVMRLDSGEFFSLTGTGATIWRLIDGRRDREELLSALADEYHAEEDQLAGDLDAFLRQLSDNGILATS